MLSWPGTLDVAVTWGPIAIIGACFCWALDNNLTRKVSLSDPLQIASLKGLVAGTVNTALAMTIHSGLPSLSQAASAATVGFFGYGVSLALFVVSLRHLGTARAGAYFSAAPFVGALGAVLLLDEPITVRLVIAAVLMGFGVWLHLTEHHEHEHQHEAFEHEHPHQHDEHHDHLHETPVESEHSHLHRHGPVMHRHPHYPDAHHRHTH
jgi:drug/metabolite transporter (DMT)-like permease